MSRSGSLWLVLVVVVAGLSFAGGVVVFNFVMAYSVGHGEEIAVPQLVGLGLDRAKRVAGEANLRIHKVGERFSASVPPGFVLEQNPPAARSVKQGRKISVIVSGGTETVEVPGLAGQSARQAIVMLDAAGLEAAEIAECTSRRVGKGSVITSSPPPEMVLERGSRVDLLVSLGAPPLRFMMPDLEGTDADQARIYLETLGAHVFRSRQFSPHGEVGPLRVLRHRPPGGHMVTAGDTVNLVVGVR
ncbi:MAG: PASTA domain-containing protein [Candidatus Eisenbacteria sp.]|nr:PASTA domain-containing protein [Candidatus Eisenbacteria bacterium]